MEEVFDYGSDLHGGIMGNIYLIFVSGSWQIVPTSKYFGIA